MGEGGRTHLYILIDTLDILDSLYTIETLRALLKTKSVLSLNLFSLLLLYFPLTTSLNAPLLYASVIKCYYAFTDLTCCKRLVELVGDGSEAISHKQQQTMEDKI